MSEPSAEREAAAGTARRFADCIAELIDGQEWQVRFMGVAWFNDLPRAHRDRLRDTLRCIVQEDESEDVKQAARAALALESDANQARRRGHHGVKP